MGGCGHLRRARWRTRAREPRPDGASPRGGRPMAVPVVLAVAAGVALSLGGCGSARPAGGSWLGDTHARPGAPAGTVSPDEPAAAGEEASHETLGRAMERARQEHAPPEAHERVILLAGRVGAVGGALDASQRDAVLRSVDRVSGARLAQVWRALEPPGRAGLPAAAVALRLARVAAHLGRDQDARAWLARSRDALAAAPGAGELAQHARELEASLRTGRQIDAATIAVLLPLSGPYAPLGAEMRAAVQVAAEDAGAARLVFVDTAGDAARAVQAVDQAVDIHGAVAVLGPVGARAGRAAAARAVERGVPIALLAPADGQDSGADPGAGVFRLWSSAAWEAAEAARLAVADGHTRLAVLAPRDEHGARAARAFRAMAEALGAEVARSGSYDPTGTALEPDVRAFLGLDPRTNARLRRHLQRHGREHGWKTFTPDVPFELLYIPDEHTRAALVAAFLPYFNVELRSREFMDAVLLRRKHRGRVPRVVQLLGSSGWHHPGLIPRGGPVVEGALIVDVYAGSDSEDFLFEEAARFAERFRARTGRAPGRVAAQAHDAALLMLAAIQAVGPRAPRADFVRALAGARLTTGACGPARVLQGAVTRDALVLRVEGGVFVPHVY